MEPFKVLQNIKTHYHSYIDTFQVFKDKEVKDFVDQQIAEGAMLWRDPVIQISKKFKPGRSIQKFVHEGILHPKMPNLFKWPPYLHQDQAIEVTVAKKESLVVTTGTGSGKSICFEIPIVDYCLKCQDQSLKGIKAIIIYPMNALANTQYEELAGKLEGTGIRIGLYTGDTAQTPAEAITKYKDVFGDQKEPKDCEVISREEIRNNPPDILITNYVQLELLLTRVQDRKLFAEQWRQNIRFLVLDELHTYSGKQGADVSFLVRRLKQRTDTIGELICIGTSATMVSGGPDDDLLESNKTVARFATKVFGEKFEAENVVTATEDENIQFTGTKLSSTISVTDNMLKAFSASEIESIKPVYEAIMGESFGGQTTKDLGEALKESVLLSFLEAELKNVQSLTTLAKDYQDKYRGQASLEDCKNELQAGLLLGAAGTVTSNLGGQVPRFITKLHTFFNQGGELSACLIEGCGYLSHIGETECPKCNKEGRPESSLYPLHFCRICGEKYYGLQWEEITGATQPWTFQVQDADHRTGYFSPSFHIAPNDYPENWLTPVRREVKRQIRERGIVPVNGKLNTCTNHFEQIHDPSELGTFIPSPFPYCPSCSTQYTGNVSEYTKLFLLNSIGRATGTDVLAAATLDGIKDKNERKLIGFTDSRQDAAFQAGHMNHWYNQIYFRRLLKTAIDDNPDGLHLNELPIILYPQIIDEKYIKPVQRRRFKQNYLQYLETFLLLELRGTKKFTSVNLEDIGLIEIDYYQLDEYVPSAELSKYNILSAENSDLVYDYLKGIMDIFRRENAFNHPNLLDRATFDQQVIGPINQILPDKRIFEAVEGTKPGCFSNAEAQQRRLLEDRFNTFALRTSRTMTTWTRRCFGTDIQNHEAYLNQAVAFLTEMGYIESYMHRNQEALLLHPDILVVKKSINGPQQECHQCKTKYNWKVANGCLKNTCRGELQEGRIENNYFSLQYSQDIEDNNQLIAKEHSGQVDGQTRKKIEKGFKAEPPELQLLMATPTMELGIDIGTLSAVYMRNVPPNPSNYAQRAGRAGRSGQGSIVTTFCGSGPGRGPHDQYFYNRPLDIVSGKISAPRFNLDNPVLFQAHLHSIVFQTLQWELPNKAESILDFINPELPLILNFKKELSDQLELNKQRIINNIESTFEKVIQDSKFGIKQEFIEEVIDAFLINFDKAYEKLRDDFRENIAEINDINKKINEEGAAPNWHLDARRRALEKRNYQIKNGQQDFYTYRYLSQVGFLPNYAFPTKNLSIKFLHEGSEKEIDRDQLIAIRELAPLNDIYYGGQKLWVERVSRESDLEAFTNIVVCDECDYIEDLGTHHEIPTNCRSCGTVWDDNTIKRALTFPRMMGRRRMRITADEEERSRGGYIIKNSYFRNDDENNILTSSLPLNSNKQIEISFERNATMYHANLGFAFEMRQGRPGFTLDPINRYWVANSDDAKQRHCENREIDRSKLHERISLYMKSRNDVLTLELSDLPAAHLISSFAKTFLHTLLQSICHTLDLDDSEIRGYYQLVMDINLRFVIFETTEGGTGSLEALLAEESLIRKVAHEAMDLLHYNLDGTDKADACESSCYNCICNFYNQRDHMNFDRNLVKDILMQLS